MKTYEEKQIEDLLLKLGYSPRMFNSIYKAVFTSQGECIGHAQVSYGNQSGYVKLYIGDLTISSEYHLIELQVIYKKLISELETLGLKVMNDNRHIDKEVKVNND